MSRDFMVKCDHREGVETCLSTVIGESLHDILQSGHWWTFGPPDLCPTHSLKQQQSVAIVDDHNNEKE